MARFAPLYQVQLQDATAEVRGRFSPADKLGLEGPGGAFQEVAVQVEVRSAAAGRVRELLAHAERGCHSAQSLRAAVPVRLHARSTATTSGCEHLTGAGRLPSQQPLR